MARLTIHPFLYSILRNDLANLGTKIGISGSAAHLKEDLVKTGELR